MMIAARSLCNEMRALVATICGDTTFASLVITILTENAHPKISPKFLSLRASGSGSKSKISSYESGPGVNKVPQVWFLGYPI